ncbi:hypothetical protein [Streptomyces sp. NBC_01615]
MPAVVKVLAVFKVSIVAKASDGALIDVPLREPERRTAPGGRRFGRC